MKKFEVLVDEVWKWRTLKLKRIEVGEIENSRYLKLKKFVVEEVWSWRSLNLKFGAFVSHFGLYSHFWKVWIGSKGFGGWGKVQ